MCFFHARPNRNGVLAKMLPIWGIYVGLNRAISQSVLLLTECERVVDSEGRIVKC